MRAAAHRTNAQMKTAPHRIVPWLALLFALLSTPLVAQKKQELENPKLEEGEAGKAPPGWHFNSRGEAECTLDTEAPFEGKSSALVDASALAGRGMSNIMQSLDATPWRGKRVRFRAAVKTAELAPGIGAQLWFRVDRPKDDKGNRQMGGFDNMGSRPITGAEWQHYDIVLDVAEDASGVVLGMFLRGKGKAWIDDVSMEVVEKSVRETAVDPSKAPQQSFWTWWLLLPAFAITMFFVGMWPTRPKVVPQEPPVELANPDMGWMRYFALRFTVCYWLLYALPAPIGMLLTSLGAVFVEMAQWFEVQLLRDWAMEIVGLAGEIRTGHIDFEAWMSHITADWFFGIEGELIRPRGSGDTTMSYLTILNYFTLSLLLATAWTFLLRKLPSRDGTVDLLRTFLRYVLASYMMSYGLAKFGFEGGQFGDIGEGQLNRTWGETSPMGAVWGFMSASRPYTIFAGLGELLAAVFLIWRRTALLGALFAVGVMTNVVMLNYCYDVPVKISSTHLVLMGLVIMAPDARRLLALLARNRNSDDPGTPNVWAETRVRWLPWAPKFFVVSVLVLWPTSRRVWDMVTHEAPQAEATTGEEAEKKDAGYLLVDRGFRWINEVPFNR